MFLLWVPSMVALFWPRQEMEVDGPGTALLSFSSHIFNDVIISSATVPVTISLIQVTSSKGICFKASFPSTVELPQQNDASNASNEAIIDLLSKNKNDLFPKVVRYPPRIAIDAKKVKRFDSFSLRIILAKEIANSGCNFCINTTTDRSM